MGRILNPKDAVEYSFEVDSTKDNSKIKTLDQASTPDPSTPGSVLTALKEKTTSMINFRGGG